MTAGVRAPVEAGPEVWHPSAPAHALWLTAGCNAHPSRGGARWQVSGRTSRHAHGGARPAARQPQTAPSAAAAVMRTDSSGPLQHGCAGARLCTQNPNGLTRAAAGAAALVG